MSVTQLSTSDTMETLRQSINSHFTSVGDFASLDSDITSNASGTDVISALNYIFGLAQNETTNFSNAVTFADNVTVQGNSLLEGNATVNGTFGFNTGVSVLEILDEDNMSSDSASALATQQSIKSYVDTVALSINALTLNSLSSTSFLRSDSDTALDSGTHLQIGAGAGSVRLEHNTSTNATTITPHDGTSYNTALQLGFDADEDTWYVESDFVISGGLTSLGILDNATANRLQLENSLLTLKTNALVQGDLDVEGSIEVPSSGSPAITNDAGEYLELNGTSNQVNIYAGANLSARASSSVFTLYHSGSAKLATASTGISVTGQVDLTGNIFGGTTVSLRNSSDDRVEVNASNINLVVNGTTRVSATTSGASITGTLAATEISSSGSISGTDLTLTSDMTVPNSFILDNGSGEGLVLTTTTSALRVGSTSRVTATTSGATITGDLSVSGNISGNITDTSFGNITTGTISTSGSITLPNSTSQEVGNANGELVRFNGSSTNTTEIHAGGNNQINILSTAVQLRYSASTKLATTNTGISVTGAITATGDVTAYSSDERLKNIQEDYTPLKNPLETIKGLRGIAFTWNDLYREELSGMDDDSVKLGVLAQDIERVIPEALGDKVTGLRNDKYLTVRYSSLIPLLIESIKELERRIDSKE